jgi:hypothetical protein
LFAEFWALKWLDLLRAALHVPRTIGLLSCKQVLHTTLVGWVARRHAEFVHRVKRLTGRIGVARQVRSLRPTAVLVLLTTLLDWVVGHNVSLAALYILPMMLGAVVLRPAETAVTALICSYLRSRYDTPGSPVELEVILEVKP